MGPSRWLTELKIESWRTPGRWTTNLKGVIIVQDIEGSRGQETSSALSIAVAGEVFLKRPSMCHLNYGICLSKVLEMYIKEATVNGVEPLSLSGRWHT